MAFTSAYDIVGKISQYHGFHMHQGVARPRCDATLLKEDSHSLHWSENISSCMPNRRSVIKGFIQTVSLSYNIAEASAKENGVSIDSNTVSPTVVTLPLEPASGGTFCIRCTLFDEQLLDNFKVYRAIVDTGSPYLVLPSTPLRGEEEWIGSSLTNFFSTFGSFDVHKGTQPLLLIDSEYLPTDEIYGSVKGQISWKQANYKFRDPRLQIIGTHNTEKATAIVGVLDNALTAEATGGADLEPYALLGLIKNSNLNADKSRFPDPRPTFFDQEKITANNNVDKDSGALSETLIKSFSVNGPARELSFSSGTLIRTDHNIMPLIDLRQYGDFVDHYTVLVESVTFDGVIMTARRLQKASRSSVERPIVAVFDSGLTGCLLTRPLWSIMQTIMTDTVSKKQSSIDNMHQFHSVALSILNCRQQPESYVPAVATKTLIQSSMEDDSRMFYVDPIDLDWFDDSQRCPYVIVLGQTFLRKGCLTIDMERRISSFRVIDM